MYRAGFSPKISMARLAPPIPSKGATKTKPCDGGSRTCAGEESTNAATYPNVVELSSGLCTWYRPSVCLSRQQAPQVPAGFSQQPQLATTGRHSQTAHITSGELICAISEAESSSTWNISSPSGIVGKETLCNTDSTGANWPGAIPVSPPFSFIYSVKLRSSTEADSGFMEQSSFSWSFQVKAINTVGPSTRLPR